MRSRLPIILLLSMSLTTLHVATAAEPVREIDSFGDAIQPFLAQHCIRCHGPDEQSGEFRVDTLSHDVGSGPSVNHWLEVIEKLNSGEMPPEDEPTRPTAEQSGEVVEWLAARIEEGRAARLAGRGRVSFRRLSREEYVYTIYDMLGVHFDASDPGGLDEDPRWQGFERIGAVLSLSPSHMEKYFSAAETILAEAYPDKLPETNIVRKRAIDLRGGPSPKQKDELEQQGLLDKVRVDMWPGHAIKGGRPGPDHEMLRQAGVFKVRIQVSGLKPPGGRPPHLTFYADKVDRLLFAQDILAPEDEPIVVEFETHLPAGGHTFQLMNDVPGPSILPRSGRSGRNPFISIEDGRIPWQLKLTDEQGVPLYPFLIVDWVEWEGPIHKPEDLQKRAPYMPAEEGNLQQTREALQELAERAFRRPLEQGEIDQYVRLVEEEIDAGADFRTAMKTGMLAILNSDKFLHIVEGSPDQDRQRLTDWELATRLSYFLWSSLPDEALLATARGGSLHRPEVLRQQVERMLAHPKADRFAESFPRQWLQLDKVGMFPPDSKLYPEYDRYLEQSMVRESTEYFARVMEENLSLREFLSSDWTMLNPRLAMHYELDGPAEDRFAKIALPTDADRGGILTHASVLSLTSDGTRHRPVHRGVWVSESIFGKTPPPPPANVDPIEPNPVDSPKATIRMKLDAHKSDANCAACHRKIDPLGLAFDNYDAIGRWRTEERVPNGTGPNPPVDASGVLPDGRAFSGPEEFKQLLLEDIDRFNHTFVEKLATYALRRAMTVDDREALAAIAAESAANEYRIRELVLSLVLSDLFQNR